VAVGRPADPSSTPSPVWRPTTHHPGSQLLGRHRLHGPYLHAMAAAPGRELGCGSPATVWRRLEEWAKAGVFDALHLEMLDLLGEQGRLDWTRASVDTMSVRAKRGGTMWAQIPSTAANQDLSSTWSPTARACRWRPQSPQPTPTTVWCLRRCLMTSRRYAPRAVGGVAGPPRSTPIRGMTLGTAAPICDGVGSRLGSHAVGSSRRSGWGGTAGGWSGRCPG
jgi:hypothetical protein